VIESVDPKFSEVTTREFLEGIGGKDVTVLYANEGAEIHRIQSVLVTAYLLELVGATAITSLGWAACRMLQIDWMPSAPLWFAGYLLVYNLDRLYRAFGWQ